MSNLILILLLIFLNVTAFASVLTKNLINTVIYLSIFSGILVVILVFLQAPDVALTEAVIAAGALTAFFIITINKTREYHD